jgi:hypothetical protein
MNSSTYTDSTTFTITHARHLAAKVATDLKRMQRFYGKPSDSEIEGYETEIIELLRNGYLGTVTYGFIKDDKWIEPTIMYNARELSAGIDDDPGRVPIGTNIEGASFYSYLTYSNKWNNLSWEDKDKFKKALPFYRGGADEPSINGYLSQDKTYSSGGRSLNRSIVKSY